MNKISLKRINKALEYKKNKELAAKIKSDSIYFWYDKNDEDVDKKKNEIFLEQSCKFLEFLSEHMLQTNLHDIIHKITHAIEPPSCQKSHCEHHTAYSFCSCDKELVPGRCKDHREYLQRKMKKENKTPGKYFPAEGSKVTVFTTRAISHVGVIGKSFKEDGRWKFMFTPDSRKMGDSCIVELYEVKQIKIIEMNDKD